MRHLMAAIAFICVSPAWALSCSGGAELIMTISEYRADGTPQHKIEETFRSSDAASEEAKDLMIKFVRLVYSRDAIETKYQPEKLADIYYQDCVKDRGN